MPTLLGEIISWDAPSEVESSKFKDVMVAAGLGDHVPALKAGTALSRSFGSFTKNRVIRPVKAKTAGEKTYQFTEEQKTGDGYEYERETSVTYDPKTKKIICPDKPELESPVQEAFDHKLAHFQGGDVTKALQAALNAHGDLFQLKSRASFYFVPAAHQAVLETVAQVLKEIGGEIIRFPIGDDVESGKAVKAAVSTSLEATASQYEQMIEELDLENARPSTTKAIGSKLEILELKADGYAYILQETQEKVKARIQEAKKKLKDKLNKAMEDAASAI